MTAAGANPCHGPPGKLTIPSAHCGWRTYRIWDKEDAERDTLRKLYNGLLGRVHILVALVLERATLDRPE